MKYNEKWAKKNWYIAIYYPAVEDEDSYYDNDVLKHRNKMSVLSWYLFSLTSQLKSALNSRWVAK